MSTPAARSRAPSSKFPAAVLLAFGLALLATPAMALDVELRLVPHDRTGESVAPLERSQPVFASISTAQGVRMEQVGVAVTSWARNVLLDGKPVFERYHDGRYVDRLPVATAALAPGDHLIWPGDHAFTVTAEGGLRTQDPTLVVDGTHLLIKTYPVTVRGLRTDGDDDAPAPLPQLTIRDATDAAPDPVKGLRPESRELLPTLERFAPLTVWLPANAVGHGYLLHPVGLSFHLGDKGIEPAAGGGTGVQGVQVAGNGIRIPIFAFPLAGDPGTRLVVTGVQDLAWFIRQPQLPALADGQELRTSWYPRTTPYELRLDDGGPALQVDGDLSHLPVKAGRITRADRLSGGQQLVFAELADRHLRPGQQVAARIRALDVTRQAAAQQMLSAAKAAAAEADAALASLTARITAQTAELTKEGDAATPALRASAQADAARRPQAEAAVESAKKALAAATAARDAVIAIDDAATWTASARLQTVGSTSWIAVPLARTAGGAPGEASLAIPTGLAVGAYRLEIVVASPDGGTSLTAHVWVTIADDHGVGVGIFTQRGRTVFTRGEDFWIAVGAVAVPAKLPAGDLELWLTDGAGTRIPVLHRSEPAADAGRRTAIVRIPSALSAALAAGTYQVEASYAGERAAARQIELVESQPTTHFTNLLPGKYSSTTELYTDVLRNGDGAAELAAGIAGLGFNAFMGMSYDVDRLTHPRMELERVVRETPRLGPGESYYQPSGRELFMDEALRHGLRFYEDIFTYHDTQLPRGEQNLIGACERYVSLETASMRTHPAFTGVCLYDEIYWVAPEGIPPSVASAIDAAEEVAFRQAYPGLTSDKAAKAMERFIGAPAGQRKRRDLDDGLAHDAFRDREWADFSRRMAGAAKQAMPNSSNFTMYRAWGDNGGNLAPNGTASDVNGPLDVAACVMYKDGGVGDRPVFAPMMADVLRSRPDQPVWTQLFGIVPPTDGDAILRQAFFGLSQQVEGLTFFNFTDLVPIKPAYLDNRDAVRNVTGLTTRLGDFLGSLRRGYQRVGILFSRRADLLGVRKPEKLTNTCEGLWVACMRAGFPADFIYDAGLLAGEGDRYQAVFAPGFTIEQEADPAVHDAIKRLVDSGKTVLVERGCKLDIEGLVRLDSDLDEYDDKLGGAFPQYIDFEFDAVFKGSEAMTALVRSALAKRIQPAAEHDLLVGPDWLARGQGQYLMLANFAPVGFTGSSKTLHQAPSIAKLRFPKRPPACYDVLRMQPLQPVTDGDWMTLDLDMRSTPGAIAAFLPAPINGVVVQAPASIAGGAELPFAVTVVDAAGTPIDASFPLEISLSDPHGKLVNHVYRAASPRLLDRYRVAANGTAGTWTLNVRELISGRGAAVAFQVTGAALPAATLDERTVWMQEPQAVNGFIAAKDEAVIALTGAQEWVRPQAERLVAELAKRGRTARIVVADDVIRLPNEWGVAAIDGARLWRGEVVQPGLFVDRPLILLGRRGENRLIEALVRRDVLPQPLSSGFPGPGKGLVDLTRRAFSNVNDTLSLLSDDAVGLARCVDAALAGTAPVSGPPPAVAAEPQAPLAASAPVAPAAAAANLQPTAMAARDWVRVMDVDSASGQVVVGTQGFGHNLFCFAADGTLRWKQFLPEHDVYYAAWCDAGRKIVAATARGYYVFILDATDGHVLSRLPATEWPPLHYAEGPVGSEQQIVINQSLGQILVSGSTGIAAFGFDGKLMWFRDRADAIAAYPADSEQTKAANFGHSLAVGDSALSPDGMRLAHGEYEIVGSTVLQKEVMSVWAYRPMVLDARTGAVLAVNRDDAGTQTSPSGWSMSWPVGSADPVLHTAGLQAPLHADGSRGPLAVDEGTLLDDGGILIHRDGGLAVRDASRVLRWSTADATRMLADLDALSPDGAWLYRCDVAGRISAVRLRDGTVAWTHDLANGPALLRPTADGVVCGDKIGDVVRLGTTGSVTWQATLGTLHEQPAKDYPGYIRAAIERDRDGRSPFPSGIDAPGDLDAALRFGSDQLVDGDFEAGGPWAMADAAAPEFVPTAKHGARALALAAGRLATQPVDRRLVPYATYLLEFWYRVEEPGAFITAGAECADGDKPSFTGSRFQGRPGEWVFGRLALKTLAKPSAMKVGFEASGGRVLIDDVHLRAVRFPSANMLAAPDLAVIEPTHAQDPRVVYDHLPSDLRSKMMQRNRVTAYKQGEAKQALIFMQEEAFLHNGRLDDLGPVWLYQPDAVGFSVSLTKPAWVSDLVLYLSNSAPEDTYGTISILANDLDTKVPRNVALVRGNHRRFLVVHFADPVRTDSLKILPLQPAHHESLTEVEVYGPLTGPGAKEAQVDPDAVPMAMGVPSHAPALPEDAVGTFAEIARQQVEDPAFSVGLTAADGWVTLGDAHGGIIGYRLPAGDKKDMPQSAQWNLQSVAPTTTPTRVPGCLLVGSADHRLHAVSDDGTYLWGFVTGGRIRSAPLAVGDDVYVGSDDGHLYKVDVHSGTLLWEFTTGDCIRGAPLMAGKLVCVASADGFLYAVDAESGLQAWKAPIAPQTRSTAALAGDVIVIGDEDGVAHAFDAASGAERWHQALDGRVSTCPLVTPEGVVFIADDGAGILVGGDGAVRWKRARDGIVNGQPIATRTQVLIPTTTGVTAIRRADGAADPRFVPPAKQGAIRSLLSYRGDLLLAISGATTDYSIPPRTYAKYFGAAVVWRVVPPPAAEGSK